ncbi:MAG: tRNA (adenosine(37)-N6)-dimethylallyltransferase MiaA [Alphaproteobacteria bacterium]|nr:tRNA (adenosine(37)-N6)-dimethylallyltransferase MiaA [Alphaproteobacteria bacterium]
MKHPILIIAGPTASGKSSLATRIALQLNGAIINADSMQVYSCFPILSAQPDAQTQAAIPHYLYGTVHASTISTAASWRKDAMDVIAKVLADGKTPVVVGGTGLYLEALMHGISEIPDVPDELRDKIIKEYETMGGPAFRDRLMKVDKAAAIRLPPGDSQRLIRAYAVYAATGKSISYWQRESMMTPPAHWDFKTILLLPERDTLYVAIDKRFLQMMDAGAIEEVKQTPVLEHPSQKALGVQELQSFVRGEISREEAIDRAQQFSRNYAKRQLTWFKNRFMKKEEAAGRTPYIIAGENYHEQLLALNPSTI